MEARLDQTEGTPERPRYEGWLFIVITGCGISIVAILIGFVGRRIIEGSRDRP